MKFIKGVLKLVIAMLIVLAIILGVGWFLVSTPHTKLDTTWTEEDLQSYIDKLEIEFNEEHASMEDIFAGNFVTEGVVEIDTVLTSSELSAIANMSTNQNSIMKDINVKCLGNDTVEVTGVTGDLTNLITVFPQLEEFRNYFELGKNKPIYMKSTLFYDETTQKFGGTTKEMYIGKIKMPIDEANNNLRKGGTLLNDMVKSLDGFSVKSFEVTEEGFQFNGTIPKEIRSAGKFDN